MLLWMRSGSSKMICTHSALEQSHGFWSSSNPVAIQWLYLLFSGSATANELAISANPFRLAQFSYNLVACVVNGIIPLSIRLAKNPKDMDAAREMLAIINNKLYQARDA